MDRKKLVLVVGLSALFLLVAGALYTKSISAAPTILKNASGKLFFDDFNRASVGSNYVAEGIGTNGWSVVNNRLRFTSVAGNAQAYLRENTALIGGDAIYDFTFSNSSNSLVAPRFNAQKSGSDFYAYDTEHGVGATVYRVNNGAYNKLITQPFTYAINQDYRAKIRVGAQGTGATKTWLNEALLTSGNDSAPLTNPGNLSLHVGNFGSGATVEFDNVAVYKSTNLTVNGTYGSWALYKNDGVTRVGPCNTASVVDYATITSFPTDYASGPDAGIKVFPVGVADCSGPDSASYVGTAGNEIFGGDIYSFGDNTDTTPPVRSNGKPVGTLPRGTTSATLSLNTDELATCRYSTTANTAYSAMTNNFSTTNATSHSAQIAGLADGTTYNYYVGCIDQMTNANTDDFLITFKVDDNNFKNQVISTGYNQPTALAFTPSGKMLVAEIDGTINVVETSNMQVSPTPFLQLTNIYSDQGYGLVGLALDPGFASNGYYYVFYMAQSPQFDRVSRFTANPATLTTELSTELVLWQDDDPTIQPFDHRGGAVAIGPEGYVYFSVGDHLKPSNPQSLSSYAGKVMRIKPDGTIPADNPFNDGAGPNKDVIWARGFRNPFRLSFDSQTGTMYEGDVGDVTWEEVNKVVKGANYGWPQCEGNCTTPGMTNPIYTYNHNGRGASITGGFVYHGTQFPAEYQGNYFYGDYAQNWIRRLTFNPDGTVKESLNFEPPNSTLDGPYGSPVDLKEGPDGAIYYADVGGLAANDGTVRRITYTPSNQPPIAKSSSTPSNGSPPLSVAFSSAGSSDPEGQPLTYAWDFGDGTATSSEANPAHVYQQKGTYTVNLRVSDGVNTSLATPLTIVVGTAPEPTISSPVNNVTFQGGEVISYNGDATDAEDGTLPASAFSWTVIFHHDDHQHDFIGPITGSKSGQFTIPVSGHDFRGNTRFEVILKVTDSDGTSKSTSVFIFPQKVNLAFATTPSGLNLIIDGITKQSPQVYDTLVGFKHTIEAPDQTMNGKSYAFDSWSDGGTRSREIVAPASDQTYTATFNALASVTKTSSGKLFFDDFNRPSLGSNYTAEGLGTSGWSIVNNRLHFTSVAGNGQAYLRENGTSIAADTVYDFSFNTSSNSMVAPRFIVQKSGNNFYAFDTNHGAGVDIYRVNNNVYNKLVGQPFNFVANQDYRAKMKVGAQGNGVAKAWIDEVLMVSGNDPAALTTAGNLSFHVGNFGAGAMVEYDNVAAYRSTSLTVNGTYGSWALYKNDGTTRVGSCNTAAVVDYATITSFPIDYGNGPGARIKIFPAGVNDCSGTPGATYIGTAGNEIFGGDVYTVQ